MKRHKKITGPQKASTRLIPDMSKVQIHARSGNINELNKNLKLKIPPSLSKKLNQAGVENLKDILKIGGLSKFKEEDQEHRKALETLESHARLSNLSASVEASKHLIEQGFDSAIAISTVSKEEFIEKIKNEIPEEEAERLHTAALAVVEVLNGILSDARETRVGNSLEASEWRDILGGQSSRPD